MSRSSDQFDLVDLSDESPVLVPASAPEAVKGLPVLDHRAAGLILCRESNEYDSVLMLGLIQQTLSYVPHSPAIDRARNLGLDPLTATASEMEALPRSFIKHGRATAVLFEVDNLYFLYSMTSAAKTNDVGENDWTNICVAVIGALRPETVYVASLSRLVRSFEHTGTLLSSVSKNVDAVHAGQTILKMRGPDKEMGHMMWGLLATVAAAERNLIVQRLTAGLVAKYRRNEWIKGKGAVPLGYKLDPATKRLEVDPNATEALRVAWTLMADPSVPDWKTVQRLADMGVTTHLARTRYGDAATVGDLSDANTYLSQVRRWSHLYLTGQCTIRWPNPFEGAPHIAGMPVHPSHLDNGELRFHYDLGRPDIDPAIIQAGLDSTRSRPNATRRKRVPPLNGQQWRQDGLHFWLTSGRANLYELRVRNEEATS